MDRQSRSLWMEVGAPELPLLTESIDTDVCIIWEDVCVGTQLKNVGIVLAMDHVLME